MSYICKINKWLFWRKRIRSRDSDKYWVLDKESSFYVSRQDQQPLRPSDAYMRYKTAGLMACHLFGT